MMTEEETPRSVAVLESYLTSLCYEIATDAKTDGEPATYVSVSTDLLFEEVHRIVDKFEAVGALKKCPHAILGLYNPACPEEALISFDIEQLDIDAVIAAMPN